MLRLVVGKLSKECIEKIPKPSFTNLLLKPYDTFTIEETEKEKIYSQSLLVNRYDIGLFSSVHIEKRCKNCYIYESSTYLHYLNNYLKEDIYSKDDIYNYQMLCRTKDKRYITVNSIKKLTEKEEIWRIYEELRYKIENEK
jgi:hypothetical protein